MYLQVINPIDHRTHLSPKEVERLVYRAAAAVVIMPDGEKRVRYLEDYEQMRLRAEIAQERNRIMYEVMLEDGIVRRWVSVPSGGIPVLQLLPVTEVGTDQSITPRPDKLIRREPNRTIRSGVHN